MRFETKAIHCGQQPDSATGSVVVPVYQTSTFQQQAIGVHKGYEYSRTGNPTRAALEEAIAALESGRFGLAFASGVAATAAVFNIVEPGNRIVAGDDLYGGSIRLAERVFKRYGIEIVYADIDDPDSFSKACNSDTKLIWIETPTNPLLKIVDISAVAKIAHQHNALLAVDNTFASPYFQRPLELGADIVVQSTTKYLAGHSDIVGGAVITSDEKIFNSLRYYQNTAGAIPAPWDCWLVLRGMKTLAVRMRQHEINAFGIAEFLESHEKVKKVYYPGLKKHPQYELAKRQMSGFSGMVSFEIDGTVDAVNDFASKLKIFTLAESLGGVESLVCYPPSMTHGFLSHQQRIDRGISDSLIRLSVGIEDIEDLKEDIANAL
ncbi:MAG: PLP-dependent aspartate aminotransferase family protein [Phycisphaerae bacterium]